jgi:hypothetical protein
MANVYSSRRMKRRGEEMTLSKKRVKGIRGPLRD